MTQTTLRPCLFARSVVLGAAALTMVSGHAAAVEAPAAQAAPAAKAERAGATVARRFLLNETPTACEDLPAALRQAIETAAAESSDPAATRAMLLDRVVRAGICFDPQSTPEQYAEIMRKYQALPPGLLAEPGERFFTDTTVWATDGGVVGGGSGRAQPARLTVSFPGDGVSWGQPGSQGPNTLNAALSAAPFSALDRGREFFRQSLASWRRYSSVTYFEVRDDNSAMDTSTSRVASRGDIRIGSISQGGPGGVLAYNFFPNGGGDMTMDTDDFTGSNFSNTNNNFRFLRNTVAHEHGHGLGYAHPTPCNNTKLMEPFLSTAFDMVQIDERRGVQRNYGDRYAGNNSAANARDFGNLTTPTPRSIIERDLSTNGVSGFNNSNQDWFRFTIDTAQNVTISVVPTGGTYQNAQQTSGCNPTTGPNVVASQAGNLTLELRAADGTTILNTAAGAAGATETITRTTGSGGQLPAGTYFVRVIDVGPNDAANQIVQLYDMTLRIGNSTAVPYANAGINGKRIAANTNCYFMGDINSAAKESGASIANPGGYAWDLDGDGTFEVVGQSQPNRQYTSSGVYNVTLRVTDSNGQTDTDTVTVTVFGGTTNISSVSPNTGGTGTIVPITINGANFKTVTAASQVTVSGTGVTVTGTPVSNALGTQLTGLSLNIGGGATLGGRSITVTPASVDGGQTPADAPFTLSNAFTVVNSGAVPGAFNLDLPANGATGLSLTPSLSWTSSLGAATYDVAVATDSGFSNIVASATGLTGTSWMVSPSLSQTTGYFWRVRAVNANGSTASTPASRSFTTFTQAPGAFNLLSPSNGTSNVVLSPTLLWSTSTGAASYTVQVSTDAGFGTIVASQTGVTDTFWTVPVVLAPGVQHFWRVVAVNAGGNTNSNPISASFTTATLPAAFNLTQPADQGIGIDPVPTFQWSASAGASSYSIDVASDAGFTTIVASATGIGGLQWTLPLATPLNFQQKYWWRVTATNLAGTTASNPVSRVFKVRCQADIDSNGSVGANDLSTVLAAFGSNSSSPNWNPVADLDNNGSVGANDLSILLSNFGCSN
ncbi:MAG: matrixin family metalloprotease, partial [Phycisphaerales bacterium]|nr:matrixin family metalloprotease [Phycisphaerales bacterium]